ncbi:MAG: DnaD domain protein [Ruminococcaceae bacterium]|nr:DnaD domain protein [Oscillospiraceae bacterium]
MRKIIYKIRRMKMSGIKMKKQNIVLPMEAASPQFLCKASDTALRLLLFLAANDGKEFTAEQLAEVFSVSETAVNAAIAELCELSIFAKSKEKAEKEEKHEKKVEKTEREPTLALSRDELMEKYSSEVIARGMAENRDLRMLYKKAETIMGHILSSYEMADIYGFYDNMKLPPAVISMLLTYCANSGKTHIRQIEKIAVFWHENGIVTVDAAEKYITALAEREQDEQQILKMFSIKDRKLTKTEKEMLVRWRAELEMPMELIEYAGELCMMRTGKVAFPYMNKILSSWHEAGITTLEGAKAEGESKQKSKKSVETTSQSYDIEAYKRISMERLNKRGKHNEGE